MNANSFAVDSVKTSASNLSAVRLVVNSRQVSTETTCGDRFATHQIFLSVLNLNQAEQEMRVQQSVYKALVILCLYSSGTYFSKHKAEF